MEKVNLLQSSVSRDPSEIFLIWWFVVKKIHHTFLWFLIGVGDMTKSYINDMTNFISR